MDFKSKLLDAAALRRWREKLRQSGEQLAVTNGCFDLLHLGHATYLQEARRQADRLLVGVNSDASVRSLKGPNRPLNSELDRALVLAALESVDGVYVFQDKRAVRFL